MKELIALDQDETGIFNLEESLRHQHESLNIRTVVADTRDSEKMNKVFAEFMPEVVFHAAACRSPKAADDAERRPLAGLPVCISFRAALRHSSKTDPYLRGGTVYILVQDILPLLSLYTRRFLGGRQPL